MLASNVIHMISWQDLPLPRCGNMEWKRVLCKVCSCGHEECVELELIATPSKEASKKKMNDTCQIVSSIKEAKQSLPRPPAEEQETKTESYSVNQVAGSFCNFQQYGNGPMLYDYDDACKSGELWDTRLQCSHSQSPANELILQSTEHKVTNQLSKKSGEEMEQNENDCASLPNSDHGTPTYLKWAKDLNNLLEDREGVDLFREYVKQEKCETQLEFWLACEGLKTFDPNSSEVTHLIKLIYKRFIKQALKDIKSETKRDIEDKINNKINMNQNMFDQAQKEIEDIMKCTAYPNFLESDVYLQYIRSNQNNTACNDFLRNSKSCSSSSSREGLNILPTVHEDSELSTRPTCARTPLTTELLRQRYRFTENRSRFQLEAHPNNFIRSHTRSSSSHHARYSSFLPTSAQDSELQSLSSDAQTDDTSSLADSSIDYSPAYNSKSHCKKQLRAMKTSAGLNKDHFPYQLIPRTQRLPKSWLLQSDPHVFASELIEKLNKVKQEQELEEKFKESIQKLEGDDKRNFRMCDNPGTSMNRFAALPQQLVSAVIQEKQSCVDESDQSILDQHMSRVWKDSAQQTPIRSPPLSPTPDRCKSCLSGNQLISPAARPTTQLQSCRASGSGGLQAGHQANRMSPYNMLPATTNTSKHRKERDTHSSDSGTVHDFTPENEPASYNSPPVHIHKHIHHHTTNIFSPNVMSSDQTGARASDRRSKDNSRRSSSKKISTDSSSSCVDSGVSVACDPLPISSARERTCSWIGSLNDKYTHGTHSPDLEMETSIRHKKSAHSSTSAMSASTNRSSHNKKPLAYSSSRAGSLERGGTSPWLAAPNISSSLGQGTLHAFSSPVTYSPLPCAHGIQPSQPLAQDPSMPMLPQPDTTTQLVEARRRLEDEARAKSMKTRRQNKKFPVYAANSIGPNNTTNDITVIGYCFAGESVPYRTKLPGKNVTLKQFKSLLSKKGNYRYFFKKASDEFGTGIINEEITDDNEILPLWEEKIFAIIQPVE